MVRGYANITMTLIILTLLLHLVVVSFKQNLRDHASDKWLAVELPTHPLPWLESLYLPVSCQITQRKD